MKLIARDADMLRAHLAIASDVRGITRALHCVALRRIASKSQEKKTRVCKKIILRKNLECLYIYM